MTSRFDHIVTVIVDGHAYELVGSYDSDTPEDEYEFYDIFEDMGTCINEGNPFYEQPTVAEVTDYIVAYNGRNQ